jgi:hypothetical protein
VTTKRIFLKFTAMKKDLQPEDYYISEEGYIVFTEKYHLKRGYCCKSGCRHCPYGYDKKTDSFRKTKQISSQNKKQDV